MELLDEYIITFRTTPIGIITIPYEDKMYQELMKEAIEKNKPITMEDINNYVDKHKIKFDVIE